MESIKDCQNCSEFIYLIIEFIIFRDKELWSFEVSPSYI